MNQEIQAYLRAFVTYAQYNWVELLPTAMLAINNRDTALGASPFFLTHQYNIEPIQQFEPMTKARPPAKAAEKFVERLREAQEFAQAAMASAQQRMEDNSNRTRDQAQVLKVGDAVWLNLKNISTPQASKKLSWLNAKYRVRKVVSSHVVELDVPIGIFPRFHIDLLRREVLVKWTGYTACTWEPRVNLEHTVALDEFKARYGSGDGVGEEHAGAMTGPKRKPKGREAHFSGLRVASLEWLRRNRVLFDL